MSFISRKALWLMAALLVLAQGAWADVVVTGESALKSALADGGVVKLGNDISLSGTLVIDNGYDVIIELDGHDLKLPFAYATVPVVRVVEGCKLTIRNGSASDRGQITGSWGEQNQPNTSCGIINYGTLTLDGIYVFRNINTSMGAGITNHGVLTMTNTVVEGNRSQQGGGIFNAPGATLSMEGGAIKGNTDYQSAGGLYNAGTITKFKNVSIESNTGRCIFNAGTMSMEGGTVQGGNTNGYPNNYINGGGIYNNDNGTLTISGTTISSNNAPNGGGIYNKGHLTISNDARITNNSNGTDGGGIYNAQGGIVEMTGGSITGNHSESGCYNYGTMTLTNVSITQNVGPSSDNSHGIYNVGTLTLDGCMISGHTSLFGAGVVNIGTLDMKGSTFIKENTTTENSSGMGAGVYNEGKFTISGGTITDNTSTAPTGKGGGIYNNSQDSGDKGIYMTGGTIVSNTAAQGGGIYNNSGTIIIAGGNVGEPTRGNTAAGSGGGIYNSATLSLTSGTIHGNTAYQGGGVFNGGGGKMLVTGGTIAQNEAGLLGGGICNNATLTLEGGRIYENTCAMYGGGVWAEPTSTLFMQGNPVVSGNLKSGNPDNVALGQNSTQENSARIRVTGAFTTGADVHVRSNTIGSYQITQDFGQRNPEKEAGAVFTDDAAADYGLSINQGEVYRMPLAKNTSYLQDGSQTHDAMKLSDVTDGSGVSFGSGWFVLDNDKSFANRITILGDTHLILTNGKTLTASAGIYVPEWSQLTVYAQDANSSVAGAISATSSEHNAGIGGNLNQDAGAITVYGGNITATGGAYAAGIGGGGAYEDNKSAYTTINIHGGNITATGGASGAGIGTGCVGQEMIIAPDAVNHPDVLPNMYNSHINITGGWVYATGKSGGAGIGSGADSYFLGEISISGGTVSGIGSDYILSTNANHYCSAAGIGSGMNGSCYLFRNPNADPMERRAIVRISGGSVNAHGGQYGAAGIGGGSRTYTNPVIDPGTYTGEDCPIYHGGGADVFITGGRVSAKGGEYDDETHWGDAIGCGGSYYQDNTILPTHGTLEIYDGAAVLRYKREYPLNYAEAYSRVESARDYSDIAIEPCEHDAGYNVFYAYDLLQHSTCPRCFGIKADHRFDGNHRCTACGLVSLADNSNDNAAHIASLTGSTKRDVALAGRTLYKDGLWNTLCLPFSLTAEQLAASSLEGATIKAFSSASFDEGTLTLNFSADQQTITAGVPYIVKWAAGSNIVDPLFRQVSLTSATASAVTSEFETATSPASITFQGIYDSYATGGEDKSILYLGASTGGQSELYYPDSEMTIHALRAYFKLNGIEAGGLPEPDFVRGFVLNFDGDEDPTSVSLPMAKETAGAWYDLSGRKVNTPSLGEGWGGLVPGVYIHNGRKVVVK